MLTSREKRQTLISNALVLYTKNDPEWFKEISNKILILISGKPQDKKYEIILKWVKECERQAAPVVKEQILNQFK